MAGLFGVKGSTIIVLLCATTSLVEGGLGETFCPNRVYSALLWIDPHQRGRQGAAVYGLFPTQLTGPQGFPMQVEVFTSHISVLCLFLALHAAVHLHGSEVGSSGSRMEDLPRTCSSARCGAGIAV